MLETQARKRQEIRFRYAQNHPKLILPQLILAYPVHATQHSYDPETDEWVATVEYPPRFRDTEAWLPLFHQTAGHACHLRSFFALPLTMTTEGHELARYLESKYAGSLMGMLGAPSLDDVIHYRDIMRERGADANFSYSDLEEGFYPLDLTSRTLHHLTSEELPEDLDDLFTRDLENGFTALLSSSLGLILCFLGTNCD